MAIVKPSALNRGDTIGIIAPASPPNQENLQRALSFIEGLGLNWKMGEHVKDQYGYLAGNDKSRLADLHEMFADPEVKAIICACGGYGTARIAAEADYDLIRKNPKIFWGYSDITFLHTAIRQQTGLVTFHGPMLASDIGKEEADEQSKQSFQQLFLAEPLEYPNILSQLETMIPGAAEGELTGGNLCLLASTLGTPYEINTKGKLLFIEDINEEPRSIDRMLNQLLMAGKLDDAAGLVIGDFNNCVPQRELTLSLEEILEDYVQKMNKPALKGFKIGHCSPHFAVPLGAFARMDATAKTLTIESGVR